MIYHDKISHRKLGLRALLVGLMAGQLVQPAAAYWGSYWPFDSGQKWGVFAACTAGAASLAAAYWWYKGYTKKFASRPPVSVNAQVIMQAEDPTLPQRLEEAKERYRCVTQLSTSDLDGYDPQKTLEVIEYRLKYYEILENYQNPQPYYGRPVDSRKKYNPHTDVIQQEPDALIPINRVSRGDSYIDVWAATSVAQAKLQPVALNKDENEKKADKSLGGFPFGRFYSGKALEQKLGTGWYEQESKAYEAVDGAVDYVQNYRIRGVAGDILSHWLPQVVTSLTVSYLKACMAMQVRLPKFIRSSCYESPRYKRSAHMDWGESDHGIFQHYGGDFRGLVAVDSQQLSLLWDWDPYKAMIGPAGYPHVVWATPETAIAMRSGHMVAYKVDRQGKEIMSKPICDDEIDSLTSSPQGGNFAYIGGCVTDDQVVRRIVVRKSEDLSLQCLIACKVPPDYIELSPDGNKVVGYFEIGAKEGCCAAIFDTRNAGLISRLQLTEPCAVEKKLIKVVWSPNGALLASKNYRADKIEIWRASTGAFLRQIPSKPNSYVIAWSPKGDELVTIGEDNSLQFVKVVSLKKTFIKGPAEELISNVIWREGRFVTVSDNGTMRVLFLDRDIPESAPAPANSAPDPATPSQEA